MDIYSTGAIQEVIRTLHTPKPFLLEYFFRNVIDPIEEEIKFDVEIKRRRISPFVASHVKAPLQDSAGYRTDSFKPAMVKDKRVINPRRPLQRAMGEQIGGKLTPAQREAAILEYELQDQIDMLTRRLEVMAADALIDGIVTVAGEGYPTTTVDYGRAAGHSVTLTSTARWGQSAALPADGVPLDNINTWRTTFLQNSGVPATDIIFTPGAWKQFKKDAGFKDAISTELRGSDAEAQLIAKIEEGGELIGYLNNSVRLWQYAGWYIDPADDTEKSVLTDGLVLMGNDSADGAQTRAFGTIPDPELGYPQEHYAAKSRIDFDPPVREIMMQSCPLTILSRPNATFCASVL